MLRVVTGFQQYIRSELENGKDVSDLDGKNHSVRIRILSLSLRK